MDLPISLKIENAKGKILSVLNDISITYNLPAFILEGVFADILSDIRAQSKIEALNDINLILDNKNKEGERIDNNEPEP